MVPGAVSRFRASRSLTRAHAEAIAPDDDRQWGAWRIDWSVDCVLIKAGSVNVMGHIGSRPARFVNHALLVRPFAVGTSKHVADRLAQAAGLAVKGLTHHGSDVLIRVDSHTLGQAGHAAPALGATE